MSHVATFAFFWKLNPHAIGTAGVLFAGTVAFACFGLQHARASEDLTQEQTELLAEFRADFERTKEFYMHVYMEATLQKSGFSDLRSEANPEGRSSHRVVLRRNGKHYYRVDDSALEDAGVPTGRLIIALVSPKGTVIAERDTKAGPLRVTDWSDEEDLGLAFLPTQYKFAEAPFTAYYFPVAPLVFGNAGFLKSKRVTDVRCYDESGERLVEISLEGVTIEDRKWFAHFVFYRDASWALKESIYGHSDVLEDEGTCHCQLEYDGAEDGIPLLKGASHWREIGPEQRVIMMEVCDIDKIVPGPVDEAEFTVEAIGLKIGEHRASWTRRLWLLLVSIFIILALIVISRARK